MFRFLHLLGFLATFKKAFGAYDILTAQFLDIQVAFKQLNFIWVFPFDETCTFTKLIFLLNILPLLAAFFTKEKFSFERWNIIWTVVFLIEVYLFELILLYSNKHLLHLPIDAWNINSLLTEEFFKLLFYFAPFTGGFNFWSLSFLSFKISVVLSSFFWILRKILIQKEKENKTWKLTFYFFILTFFLFFFFVSIYFICLK